MSFYGQWEYIPEYCQKVWSGILVLLALGRLHKRPSKVEVDQLNVKANQRSILSEKAPVFAFGLCEFGLNNSFFFFAFVIKCVYHIK